MALVMFGFVTYAQDCSTKIKVGKDDVKVEYYKKGLVVINNMSNEKINQIHVKVTCTETYTDQNALSADKASTTEKQKQKTETIVLCDKTFKTILPKKMLEVTDGVKSAIKAPHDGKLSNFKVVASEVKTATNEKPTR